MEAETMSSQQTSTHERYYRVTQRGDSRYIDGQTANGRPILGAQELLAASDERHAWVSAAATEADARNLIQGEGQPRWTVEAIKETDDGEILHADRIEYDAMEHGDVDPEDVFDYLVERLGVSEAEANRLVQ